jgi:hypothetical protein
VRWEGFGPEDGKWLTKRALQNALAILEDWFNLKKVESQAQTA